MAAPATARRAPRPALPRRAAPALLAFAGVRLLGVVVLALWSSAPEKDALHLLSRRWDSVWYASIAEDGYGRTVRAADGGLHSDLAFFPLLPWLERLLGWLTPLSAPHAGLVIAASASLAAALALYAIGESLHGPRAGTLLALLWALTPVSVVQSMAYTESLFTALAAWSLYAVLTGRWVAAGLLCAAAGLTRPAGLAVVAALAVAAAVAAARGEGAGRRMWAGVALAPLGWAGYVAWVGARTGGPLGYLDVQRDWGNGFDGGVAFARFVAGRLAGPTPLAGVGLCAGVVLLAWVCALLVRTRPPLPLLVYSGVLVVLAVCAAGYFGSKPRLLLPAFPLLLPAAVALARARAWAVALTAGGLAAGAAVYGAVWLTGTGPP
ncbi:mannosyltransferase family protein [Streptomyces sp. DSM 44917]|uniref:Mannosyltransferase family protein n=1 Tax=Streptomyces boetiae TaxID=3075541 RepID=A0ABU2LFM7_9ACTN|nr:mannosyltransferase family protein [Streptomyces sp. DSM 44917]MDT0310399.1 mannosyltransferase family protein [Streptomyces sp. DSM 44917]